MDILKRIEGNLAGIRRYPYVRIPLGVLLIIMGIIGGFLPIVQGWVFIFLGLAVLFGEEFTEFVEENLAKIRKKFRRN